VSQEIQYAGHEVCAECHDDIMAVKSAGYHKNVACEVCHGPAAAHTEDPGTVELQAPRGRGYCPLCHEYLPSRPTGFPQIVSASHNPIKPCITCHEPHDPKPSETPKECSACHATIARSKAISHHAYVPCTRCHETSEEHKLSPRQFLPSKPDTREFCGGCHAEDAASPKGTPRVDMVAHGERYVCWQCHYPHLPEAR
ncbi:MAG: cytochrome c3 family protein, partial [bacterium]